MRIRVKMGSLDHAPLALVTINQCLALQSVQHSLFFSIRSSRKAAAQALVQVDEEEHYGICEQVNCCSGRSAFDVEDILLATRDPLLRRC